MNVAAVICNESDVFLERQASDTFRHLFVSEEEHMQSREIVIRLLLLFLNS